MSLRVPKLIRPLDLLHNPPPKRKKKQLYICTYNYIQFTTSSKINDKLIRRNNSSIHQKEEKRWSTLFNLWIIYIDGVQYLEHMHTFILSIYSIFTLSIVAAPCSKAFGPGKMKIRPT